MLKLKTHHVTKKYRLKTSIKDFRRKTCLKKFKTSVDILCSPDKCGRHKSLFRNS